MAWVVAAVAAVSGCALVTWLAWQHEPSVGRLMAFGFATVVGLWVLAETWPRR